MKGAAARLLPAVSFSLLLVVTGCRPSARDHEGAAHVFAAHGVIEKIAADGRQVTIHHETIPGYMIAMTMDFPVDDAREVEGLVPGDEITFSLNVDQDRAWVSDLHRTGHTNPSLPDSSMDGMPQLKPGEPLPDGELIAEDGRHIHLSDFRGKVVALTFFFTRCPLPNYCPLMNRNFAQARNLLLANPKAPGNWEFLSISFDSDFDQPATLSSYGAFYRDHNADRWLFAAAPPSTLARLAPSLGLVVMRQDNALSHNLRTVVVDPQGRLYRQFNDNLWTPRQLAAAMLAADSAAPK
jgi:protein SCO1/2